jgi:hypothetical protein
MSTTVHVLGASKAYLKCLKNELRVSSIDDVILLLQKECDARLGQQPVDTDITEPILDEGEVIKNAKLECGLLWATLGGDDKAVKHFTGLKKKSYDWVKRELIKAVWQMCFLCVFRFLGT